MSYQQYGSSYGSQQYGYDPDQHSYYTTERTSTSSSSSSSPRSQADYTSSSAPRTIRPPTSYPTPPASPYTTNPYSSSPKPSSYTSPTSPGGHYSQPAQPRPQPVTPEYHCLICSYSCARKADLERHYSAIHCRDSSSLVDCRWPGCHRVGQYGFGRKDKMIEHMRDVHKADIPKRSVGSRREG